MQIQQRFYLKIVMGNKIKKYALASVNEIDF